MLRRFGRVRMTIPNDESVSRSTSRSTGYTARDAGLRRINGLEVDGPTQQSEFISPAPSRLWGSDSRNLIGLIVPM
ncbi:hypothetical protein GN956_G11451 [Arapaima gigas]